MRQKRVYKTRTFARWAFKRLADAMLCQAAREIEGGRYDADLGQGICKKRIAQPGRGKSGAVRALVAIRHPAAIFFLAGREKHDPAADFSAKEVEAAKLIGKMLQRAPPSTLADMRREGALTEICHDEQDHGGQAGIT